ncbi:cytochrome P450 [Striga asiatica]|uniref:Cytochrome P450 n=1 Tax=Striga asiatica TaxID=4170 RepID=A0A5A7RKB3_STRAF|nr:cytochrome P450 [Striga asiatica]
MDLISQCFLLASSTFLLILFVLNKFFSGRANLPLPPGPLGFPFLGETFQFYSMNPNTFFSDKVKKYGRIFKTRILWCKCVMIASPEAAKMVLVSKAHIFKPTFPISKERILGRQAIFFHQGDYHAKLRKLVLRAFMPESIKTIIPEIESIAVRTLTSCQGRVITAFPELKTYAFDVALLSIFGKEEVVCREDLKRCYYELEKGYNSLAINIPGTLFYGAMKARKNLARILAHMMMLRRQMKQSHNNDLLGSLMQDSEGLTDEQIVDNVIGVIFASRDTTASVLTWVLKHLVENPDVLKSVTEEQEGIKKANEGKGLSWADTRNMPATVRVIQETLRIASVLSFTFREAVEDVEISYPKRMESDATLQVHSPQS